MSVYKTLGTNDVAIKTALIQETEFKFVHLVKFERPSFTTIANAGTAAGSYGNYGAGQANNFGYFTDGNYPEFYDCYGGPSNTCRGDLLRSGKSKGSTRVLSGFERWWCSLSFENKSS